MNNENELDNVTPEVPVEALEVAPVEQEIEVPEVAPVAPEAAPEVREEIKPVIDADFASVKKGPNFFVIGLVALVILALGAFGYFYLKNNNQNMIVGKALVKFENVFVKGFDFDFKLPEIKENSAKLSLSMNIDSNDPEMGFLADIINSLSMNVNTETRKDSIYIETAISIMEESLIDLRVLLQKSKLFLELAEYYDKVIAFDMEMDFFENEPLSIDDLLYLKDFAMEKFVRRLKNSDFKSEKTTIRVDGKDVKVSNTIASLSEKRLVEIANGIIADLKADKRAKEIINTFSEDFLDLEIPAVDSTEPLLTINVYTTGIMSSVVGMDITIYDDSENLLTLEYRAGKKEFIYIKAEDAVIKLAFQREKQSLSVEFGLDESTVLGTLVIKNPRPNELNAKISFVGEELFTMNAKINQVTKNKEYKMDVDMKFSLEEHIGANLNAKLALTYKDISKTPLSTDMDYANAVSIEEVDLTELLESLTELFTLFAGV